MSGDTFDLVQGNKETITATLHDPGATTGDVLTVQADKSIAAQPGGGSTTEKVSGTVTYAQLIATVDGSGSCYLQVATLNDGDFVIFAGAQTTETFNDGNGPQPQLITCSGDPFSDVSAGIGLPAGAAPTTPGTIGVVSALDGTSSIDQSSWPVIVPAGAGPTGVYVNIATDTPPDGTTGAADYQLLIVRA